MILYKLKKLLNIFLYPFNLKLIDRKSEIPIYPVEATERDIEIIDYILLPKDERHPSKKGALSMASVDRLWAVIQCTKYVVKNNIEGDFVECGVWRGGCALAIAMVLNDLGVDRKIYLYDTFEGMTEPTKNDLTYLKKGAYETFKNLQKETHNEWCYASINDVKAQFKKFGLEENAKFIKGDVLETLKEEINLPNKIALIRLDTDWYESTKQEMQILFPKLQKEGVVLIDDYGWWQGSRKAVDEYLKSKDLMERILLWKTDFTGRGFIKK